MTLAGADLLAQHLGDDLPVWDGEAETALICRQARDETHDVKTFTLAPEAPRRFRFRPGQFLTFELEIDGARINRCYTIASPPTRPHLVQITVKRVKGGPVSNFLHDHLKPGMTLPVSGPGGDFSTLTHPAAKYLFLSGGSGITPLMSMARSHHDLALPCDIVFVHNARSPADIIFRHELELMARNLPGFRLAFICEDDAPAERWSGYRGRLTPAMLPLIAPDFAEREVLCCGPAPYMAAVRQMLDAAGFPASRYHEESFDFARLAAELPAPPAEPAAADDIFRIEFSRSRRTIQCSAAIPILQAASAAGMRLPFSCSQGLCGTCKSKLVSGRVEMKHQGGIRQREIDQGQILLCCSKPLGDLVIER